MIRDSSLTSSGLSSSDELNDIISNFAQARWPLSLLIINLYSVLRVRFNNK